MKQIIYSKFSNERNYRFAIRTDILEDETGGRTVRKVSIYPEGQMHTARLFHWYQYFTDAFSGEDLSFNRCTIVQGGVELEYAEGEPFDAYLDRIGKEKGIDAMADAFRAHLKWLRSLHQSQQFEETAGFREVFGDFRLNREERKLLCAPATDIDLICENIILNGENRTVIDYEWSFDFPIPVNYLLYRNIVYFREHAGRTYLLDYDFFGELGIDREEIAAYDAMEESLQKYICRDHVPVRDLYDAISPGHGAVDLWGHLEYVQVYFGAGNGAFYEERSVKLPVKEHAAKGTLLLEADQRELRIDPGTLPGFVEIQTLTLDGEDMTERLAIPRDHGIRSGQFLCFTKEDPCFFLTELPAGAHELTFSFRLWPVDAVPMEKAAEWIWQLELHAQALKETQNTKIWRLYQKYRDMIERKPE